ncbi:putative NAD(P)/FAD-binding protein YdhS [Rufibacter quisquiliarum]|uniref:Putative NAD(P)/FAD-binding protein YdhS n=1 Tax=Rufibacter quisquiliarum TaxID=1549639 RepID=A0A839GGB9_9BACT|nr:MULTISPECIES: FAD/NAD(P)-binding protein [Rufibacter]MBA9075699.1 putative NAD(P)/FAD-binding protein YdhS [Rufibacter quisquiliarum]
MEQLRIAIIGGGLSGTLTAIHLLQAAREATTVYLLEKDEQKWCRGVAYSSRLPFQPLNVPASRMTLFLDKPNDFLDWLRAHQHRFPQELPHPVTGEDFIPRHIFGEYVEHSLQAAEANARPGVQFIRLTAEVVSVSQVTGDSGFLVALNDSSTLQVQKVVLGLGNLAPAPVPILNTRFYRSSHYVDSPWSNNLPETLPKDASLLLVGSSLTMVDLVGSLLAQGHEGQVHVVSRHGLLPQPHAVDAPAYTLRHLPQQPLTPLAALQYVREEIRLAAHAGNPWQSVIDALRDHVPVVWQNFTLPQKKQFLRRLKPYWEVHRHRMPLTSHLVLEQLQQNGQLHRLAAHVLDMQPQDGKAVVTLRERGKIAPTQLVVDKVINCTGPLGDYLKSKEPLLQQLLQQNLIAPDPLHLGLAATIDGTVLNAQGERVEHLFTLGPPLKGIWYESTALREIRQQAAALAGLLLSNETMLTAAL